MLRVESENGTYLKFEHLFHLNLIPWKKLLRQTISNSILKVLGMKTVLQFYYLQVRPFLCCTGTKSFVKDWQIKDFLSFGTIIETLESPPFMNPAQLRWSGVDGQLFKDYKFGFKLRQP